jgi:hypothetical protein
MNILERLPVPDREAEIAGPDGRPFVGPDGSVLVVKQYQVVAGASLSAKDDLKYEPRFGRFPVVIDIGLNHNFAITQEQWDFWTGLTPVPAGSSIEIGGRLLFPKAAQLWIHPNEPGRETTSGQDAIRLRVPEGVIVYPTGMPNPARLPALGLRALIRNGLKLIIDGQQRDVTLSTA